ncbi:hypothetical protein Q7C36_005682 [Tachysurus vachellii]|uniref:Uncharacterized protein n=1 Tax=Tachysurus vachellii TaxID=175792 RepID=A0AA88NL18_TACVA|nr:hypothetical protein Q7C36_005682 [Tachysurus vachellii]
MPFVKVLYGSFDQEQMQFLLEEQNLLRANNSRPGSGVCWPWEGLVSNTSRRPQPLAALGDKLFESHRLTFRLLIPINNKINSIVEQAFR